MSLFIMRLENVLDKEIYETDYFSDSREMATLLAIYELKTTLNTDKVKVFLDYSDERKHDDAFEFTYQLKEVKIKKTIE